MFSFVLSVASAKIEIENINSDYSLGKGISPTVKITADETSQYIFSAEISCSEFSLKYFTQPLDLMQNEENTINIPSLKISEEMLGTCTIDFYLNSIKGDNIEKKSTAEFNILEKEADEQEPVKEEKAQVETPKEENNQTETPKKGENDLMYFGLFVLALFIIVIYIKFRINRINRKFNINKGWKLHKRRF
jgi:hypothetical protein